MSRHGAHGAPACQGPGARVAGRDFCMEGHGATGSTGTVPPDAPAFLTLSSPRAAAVTTMPGIRPRRSLRLCVATTAFCYLVHRCLLSHPGYENTAQSEGSPRNIMPLAAPLPLAESDAAHVHGDRLHLVPAAASQVLPGPGAAEPDTLHEVPSDVGDTGAASVGPCKAAVRHPSVIPLAVLPPGTRNL